MSTPSNTPLTPFQTHLTFFSTTPNPEPPPSIRPRITLLSGLRRSLTLGLNFPLAVLTTLSLRLLYGSPWSLYVRPVDVRSVTTRRTMLENVGIAPKRDTTRHGAADSVGKEELMQNVRDAGLGIADRIHVRGMWSVGARVGGRDDGLLTSSDVDACRSGRLMWDVEARRRLRAPTRDGRGGAEVLPLLRGGPYSVASHAWFVDKLFAVKVYQLPAPGSETAQDSQGKKTA